MLVRLSIITAGVLLGGRISEIFNPAKNNFYVKLLYFSEASDTCVFQILIIRWQNTPHFFFLRLPSATAQCDNNASQQCAWHGFNKQSFFNVNLLCSVFYNPCISLSLLIILHIRHLLSASIPSMPSNLFTFHS